MATCDETPAASARHSLTLAVSAALIGEPMVALTVTSALMWS